MLKTNTQVIESSKDTDGILGAGETLYFGGGKT